MLWKEKNSFSQDSSRKKFRKINYNYYLKKKGTPENNIQYLALCFRSPAKMLYFSDL